ncbi:hypothetical protein [Aliterella atlantica]|uniref:Uncharacterized protein n=1 Tax=Aliterella atlantica CENA595 TaxID=1618023 RepID=A0A0D8ZQC1_9CYAN|nr:hypothetical protein [Aliterella atlantica]KJH69401.1 hypothetical protein UH38_24160 [Aliterella atlantica CENA595]
MEWQAVGNITTTKDYAFTPIITGTLFKLKHTSAVANKSDLKIIIRQAFENDGQLALFDYKLINCKVEQDILLFSLPKGLPSRKLAIKRVDNLSDSWSIEIESLEIIEDGVDMPITLSDLLELQQQINSIQDALTLKALDIDLDNHVLNTNNPHSVTAGQIGADPAGSAIASVIVHEGSANHPVATSSHKGMISAADKFKLDGIENNATFNASDNYLVNRSNHTGLQAISSIVSLQDTLDAKQNSIDVLPINKGGTGSNTQNFVDLTNNQTIGGIKTFSSTPAIAGATATAAGYMVAADKTKLDAVSPGATVNQTDTYLLSRANHTGTQSIATIANLQSSLDGREPTITILPIAKGGTNSSTQNFVDLTNNQTIGGIKSFSSSPIIPNASIANQSAAFGQITAAQVGNTIAQWNASQLRGVNLSTTAPTSGQFLLYSATNSRWEGQGFSDTLHGSRAGGNLHAATTAANGFMLAADKSKLDAIATEATANSSDTYLLNRVNHIGISSVNSWIAPTLATGWSAFGAPHPSPFYRKLPDGTVEFKGLIKKSTAVTANEALFTLPVGFRPIENRVITTTSNSALGRIDIVATTGAVTLVVGNNSWVSLEGIRFVAEQ